MPITQTRPASESKWYHYNEPPIIDVRNLDDVTKAIQDGRFNRIHEEHERYMRETKDEICAL
jgi:hypothetical protein